MDPQAGASFIPKKPLDAGLRRRGGIGLMMLIAILIFVASVIAAGGAWSYQQYLQSSLASKAASLKAQEAAYDPSAIEDLVRLDSRINNAQTLLNNHVAVSALLAFLSTQTLVNVAWSNFNVTLQPDGSAKLTLAGSADSFSTVALQSDQFGASKYLKDVVFSSIAVGATGGISFSVAATVDPSLLLYKNSLGQNVSALPATPDASSTATTSSQ